MLNLADSSGFLKVTFLTSNVAGNCSLMGIIDPKILRVTGGLGREWARETIALLPRLAAARGLNFMTFGSGPTEFGDEHFGVKRLGDEGVDPVEGEGASDVGLRIAA